MLALVILLPNKATCFRAYRKGGEQIVHTFGMAEVRIIVRDGEPWFVAKDVAEVLGYEKPRNAITMHCKGSLIQGVPTNGGVQRMTLIPERDVYRLIMRSKLPAAERFEEWVVGEVLGYSNPAKAVADHCKCAEILKGNETLGLTTSPRGLTIIPERDVYRLIMQPICLR